MTCQGPLIHFQSETQLTCEDGRLFVHNFVMSDFLNYFSKLDDILKTTSVNLGCVKKVKLWGMFHHIASTCCFLNSIAMVYSQKLIESIAKSKLQSFGCLSGEETTEDASRSILYEG